jgi:hypothetical protein
MKISWHPPQPRNGVSGSWDKFVGPGATLAEEWLQLVAGLIIAVVGGFFIFTNQALLKWSTIHMIVIIILLLDMAGGVITNATSTAKRWYHRDGQGLQQHLGFISLHGVHILLVAWLFRGTDWVYFGVMYGSLLLATVGIGLTPLYLQRPFAMALFMGILLLNFYLFPPMPGLEWFIPFLFLKLLVNHLLKEAPFRPENEVLP